YSLIGLREQIKKRPSVATTEKVQQFIRAKGRESIVAGFYHEGYEEPLLMLMKRRGVHSGLVVKGEEGALSMTTRLRSASTSKGLPVNHCSGFCSVGIESACEVDGASRQSFRLEVNAMDYGFEPTDTPRTDRSVSKNIELGLAALRGEKGPAYDRIVLNAGIVDHLLGCDGAEDVSLALERGKEAIDSENSSKEWNVNHTWELVRTTNVEHESKEDFSYRLSTESIYRKVQGRNLGIMGLKALDYETMNENVKKVQYAVRGELYLRASELQKEGKKIIFTNVGNPHALGQKPLTFPRQVVALCQAPFLLDDPNVGLIFPADAIARAKHYLSLTSGGLGAYSDSRGIPGVRKEVAEFIERRDGYPSDPELIFLTDGASKGVMQILNCIIRGQGDGVLVPVPQYPLYSATISLFGGSLVPYYLEETANWGLDVNNLRESVAQARFKGITVRAMVIINPGNPTGQCLSEANLREILNFCYQENLVLLGDEVYQQNIYQDERPFISSRKVLMDMGPPISKEVQLVSFHTVSKGYWGECGQRGGYFEMTNIPPKTVDEIYKIASISLSPNVPAQIFMGLMVNPLKPGDVSYDQYVRESKGILESLRRRARIMTEGFNSCKNVVCNFTEGAMYSFPQLRLPPKAIEAAKQAGKVPDVFYCLKLLEATGISTVPGSGFGQKEGVFHLRTTILPAEEDMPEIMSSFKKFNDEFMAQYEDNWNRSR
ncbi:hypothetical protein Golob_026678, partial [Gossypium lobatum]|nr:hypothetical protein [Gossypium lobatum]